VLLEIDPSAVAPHRIIESQRPKSAVTTYAAL